VNLSVSLCVFTTAKPSASARGSKAKAVAPANTSCAAIYTRKQTIQNETSDGTNGDCRGVCVCVSCRMVCGVVLVVCSCAWPVSFLTL